MGLELKIKYYREIKYIICSIMWFILGCSIGIVSYHIIF